MSSVVLKRQFITDQSGKPVAVILPWEQFALVRGVLEERFPPPDEEEKLARMEQASQDLLFLADLQEAMSAFASIDSEWWEPEE